MRDRQPIPGKIDRRLSLFLGTRLAPSSSRVRPIFRETTLCNAYMCSYAYGCSEKTSRSAQVLTRRCMRYLPESMRVEPALSDFALDLLAKRRQAGEKLTKVTIALLDRLRPKGPIRKLHHR